MKRRDRRGGRKERFYSGKEMGKGRVGREEVSGRRLWVVRGKVGGVGKEVEHPV